MAKQQTAIDSVVGPKRLTWLTLAALYLFFWTAIGCAFALSRVEGGASIRDVLLPSLLHWWVWGLITPLIISVNSRLPSSRDQLSRRVASLSLLGPLWALLFVLVYSMMEALVSGDGWLPIFRSAFKGVFWHVLIYMMIAGVSEAYVYRERFQLAELQKERLQRQFSEARLHNLRIQLDPHFLFNALNTISSQVGADPKLARRMIERLGDLLRSSLESRGRQEVTLAQEAEFLGHYLAIQQIRFGDRLSIETKFPTDVRGAIVPSLFLQPLVENAIRHGISSRARGGAICISAERCGDRLVLHVQDDGVGLPSGWSLTEQTGLGLAITQERLAGLHPEGSFSFAVRRRPEGGTQVEISFHFKVGFEERPL